MNREYPSIVRGEGLYLYDDQGKQCIDSAGGAIVCNLGHGLPEMAASLKEQAERASFVYRLLFTTLQLEEAAAKVAETTAGAMDKVFFVSGGCDRGQAGDMMMFGPPFIITHE